VARTPCVRLLNPAFNKRFLRDFVFPSVVKHATTMGSQLEQVEAYTKVHTPPSLLPTSLSN
jgi:hypothetical protein